MAEGAQGRRWLLVLLVGLPVWLVVSGAWGIWRHVRAEERRERVQQAAFARRVDGAEILGEVEQIAGLVGERGIGSEAARGGLDRVAALIGGSLGPSNTGYEVRRWPGPEVAGRSWPLLEVAVPGRDARAAGVWVVAGYDAPAGGRGVERNATGVAAVMAAAREMLGSQPVRGVHFLFVPHAYELEAPVFEAAVAARRRIHAAGGAVQVLCVESLGRGGMLTVSTRDTGAPVHGHLDGLGEVVGADEVCLADDFDLASALFEAGLPAARLAVAGEGGEEESMPTADALAGAAARLVELVRRLAES